jgi:3-oxoacyl-[acyl-carrier protein] reductase
MLLKDRVAVVTGGTRGIGRAISLLFAQEGARVTATFSRDVEAAKEVVREAQSMGLSLRTALSDVTEPERVKALVEEVFGEHGRIDVWVNNAGVLRDNFVMLMSDEDWDCLIKTNLTSLFHCSKWVARKMIPARRGKIINISSISGILGTSGQTNYAASKGGMISFTKALARELGQFNIQANAVAPGLIESAAVSAMPRERVEAVLKSSSLGRLGRPDEVAQAVLFLASERSDYITGQTLIVDGGIV